jgi:hypothetical protein
MPEQEANQQMVVLETEHGKSHGAFANYARCAHTPTEVCLDLLQAGAVAPDTMLLMSRTFMTPAFAKHLRNVLDEQVRRYERRYGSIEVPQPSSIIPASEA